MPASRQQWRIAHFSSPYFLLLYYFFESIFVSVELFVPTLTQNLHYSELSHRLPTGTTDRATVYRACRCKATARMGPIAHCTQCPGPGQNDLNALPLQNGCPMLTIFGHGKAGFYLVEILLVTDCPAYSRAPAHLAARIFPSGRSWNSLPRQTIVLPK